ncbi:hypothetical protein GMRT_15590 [Giardia muris]|uniref:Uncharacterized protein n=1 Tax=Giardia muris TaxID=5742 RepID=A0A4Z1T8A1_GIAMU|nr:hypothetical protein GMRT_15590 [Giardia muris]|eukprot:TNJ28819.1 hypothetical protein GMRT_15590 [Giardia muris]
MSDLIGDIVAKNSADDILRDQYLTLKDEYGRLHQEHELLARRAAALEADLQDLQGNYERTAAALEEREQQVESLVSELRESDAIMLELKDRHDSLEEINDRLVAENRRLDADNKQHKQRAFELEGELERLRENAELQDRMAQRQEDTITKLRLRLNIQEADNEELSVRAVESEQARRVYQTEYIRTAMSSLWDPAGRTRPKDRALIEGVIQPSAPAVSSVTTSLPLMSRPVSTTAIVPASDPDALSYSERLNQLTVLTEAPYQAQLKNQSVTSLDSAYEPGTYDPDRYERRRPGPTSGLPIGGGLGVSATHSLALQMLDTSMDLGSLRGAGAGFGGFYT